MGVGVGVECFFCCSAAGDDTGDDTGVLDTDAWLPMTCSALLCCHSLTHSLANIGVDWRIGV